MTSEQPFQIAVSDDALALLKRKLDDTRLPDEVNAAEWAYGAPLADIKRLANRWKDGYDWRTHERELNALPMFIRTIAVERFSELSVHYYVRQRSAAMGVVLLLFVHGRPRSFLEVTKGRCFYGSFYGKQGRVGQIAEISLKTNRDPEPRFWNCNNVTRLVILPPGLRLVGTSKCSALIVVANNEHGASALSSTSA